eukprot:CAMPEP_0119090972 /NCGR_PEP_ID=MMETSP1178-20130426/154728_1 /TAXON_ID=33656 /ORGANISM="unid sp, Strain CCMP2000" /LENGTH=237 /DNA_ID=CAMNT_0007074433 /DNA_START=15 /DNA_END=728 /DNA_ORIENTATION=+
MMATNMLGCNHDGSAVVAASSMMARWGGIHEDEAPTLYHVPGTISSPLVQTLLELGCECVSVKTLTFPELKLPSHLAINPMGTSPAFTDGDVHVWESSGILTHLLERYDTDHKLHPPAGSKKRIKFLQLQSFILATVYPFVASLFLHTLKPPAAQDAGYVASGKVKWAESLAPVLAAALGDKPYLLGDELSAVDLLLAKPLRNADSLGVLAAFPMLEALFRRVEALPSYSPAYAPKA